MPFEKNNSTCGITAQDVGITAHDVGITAQDVGIRAQDVAPLDHKISSTVILHIAVQFLKSLHAAEFPIHNHYSVDFWVGGIYRTVFCSTTNRRGNVQKTACY